MLGKDKEGRDMDDNLLGVGAPGDAITLVNDTIRFGFPFRDPARFVAGKRGGSSPRPWSSSSHGPMKTNTGDGLFLEP